MSLIRRNGRMMKQIWVNGQEQNGRIVAREGWIDCGPAEPLTRKDRAYLAMQYFEKRKRTSSAWYELARQVTIKEVFPTDFDVKGTETHRFQSKIPNFIDKPSECDMLVV